MTKTLRIATWNIAGGRTINSSNRFDYNHKETADYFIEELNRVDADVVLLQESHCNEKDSLSHRIAHPLNLKHVFEIAASPSHIDNQYNLSQAILSRYPLIQQKAIRLPYPKFSLNFDDGKQAATHYKYLQVARCEDITFANIHTQPLGLFSYDYAAEPGLSYAHEIEQVIISELRTPYLLGGDFNIKNLPIIMPTLYKEFSLKDSLPLQKATRPKGDHIDYLLFTPEFQLRESNIVQTRTDHFLYWSELENREQQV